MSEINVGEITEVLNDKMDRDGMNADVESGADVVIEYMKPTAENNYTWYRKYKSGWVEQGGVYTANGNDIVYPLTMADTNYALSVCPHVNLNAQVYWSDFGHSQTTTGFSVRNTTYSGTW